MLNAIIIVMIGFIIKCVKGKALSKHGLRKENSSFSFIKVVHQL